MFKTLNDWSRDSYAPKNTVFNVITGELDVTHEFIMSFLDSQKRFSFNGDYQGFGGTGQPGSGLTLYSGDRFRRFVTHRCVYEFNQERQTLPLWLTLKAAA